MNSMILQKDLNMNLKSMATNTARRKSKSNQLDLLPGSVLDESASSINLPLPAVCVLPESKICKVNYVHFKG